MSDNLQQQQEENEVHSVTMRVVPADPLNFAGKPGIKPGVLFFLKSTITGKLENRPYYTGEHTNVDEFRKWFRLNMVYEPISPDDAILFGYNDKNKA